MGAVGFNAMTGKTSFAEMLNITYTVYNPSGTKLLTESLTQFWTNAGVSGIDSSNIALDPRILFDKNSGRWFASSVDKNGPGLALSNDILVAVSNTGDPTGTWTGHSIPIKSPSAPPLELGDFDTLGIDGAGVFVSADVRDRNNNYMGNTFLTINKSDLINGILTMGQVATTMTGGFAAQPVVDPTSNSMFPPEFVLGIPDPSANTTSSSLTLSTITGSITSPSLNSVASVPVNPFNNPTPAPQRYGKTPIDVDSMGPDISSNVIQTKDNKTGDNELWAVQTVLDSDPTVNHDVIRFVRIDADKGTLIQQKIIGSLTTAFYDPSIAVNSSGQVLIGFSGSGPNDQEALNTFALLRLPESAPQATAFTLVL